jgi:hypothetical protein
MEATPDCHLKTALFPVEPYLKLCKTGSLKFSIKDSDNFPFWAWTARLKKNEINNRILFIK